MAYSVHDIEIKALEYFTLPPDPEDAMLLHSACLMADSELRSRLRAGIDLSESFICAAGMLGLAVYLELKAAHGTNVESFTAGKLSVKLKNGEYSPEELRSAAEKMLSPYYDRGGFAFVGAEG